METKFYVGQKVVCIKDHSEMLYKKGKEYIINGIIKGCCDINLDLSISNLPGRLGVHCSTCGRIIDKFKYWADSKNFKPIQDQTLFIKLKEVAKKELIAN